MAAFTELSDTTLADLVRRFVPPGCDPARPPELLGSRATTGGIENTNYFVSIRVHPAAGGTRDEDWVLTRIEQDGQDPERIMSLQADLHRHGLPVPEPAAAAAGAHGRFHVLHEGRPVVLCRRLRGTHITRPTPRQCHEIGVALARMHGLSDLADGLLPHPRDADWLRRKAGALKDALLWASVGAALKRQILMLNSGALDPLPVGVIHADLFVDNALFDGERLVGIFDFHQAVRAPLITDLGVAVNEWCIDAAALAGRGRWLEDNLRALLAGYAEVRQTAPNERDALASACELAALRTCLARALPDDGTEPRKDPLEMVAKLQVIERRSDWRGAWPD